MLLEQESGLPYFGHGLNEMKRCTHKAVMEELRNHVVRCCFIAMALLSCAMAENRKVLSKVSEICHLTRDQSAQQWPVAMEGVIIWSKRGGFLLWDGDRSIWINEPGNHSLIPPRERGLHVKIEGATTPGKYAPVVILQRIDLIGTRPLPPPQKLPMEQLLSGSAASQYIQVEGVMQRVEKTEEGGFRAEMMVAGHICHLMVIKQDQIAPHDLIDARVVARGVYTPETNFRSEAIGLQLMIDSAAQDLEIQVPPPRDVFSLPRVQLSQLLPYSPKAQPYHRKVTSGDVTYAVPGWFFFLSDGQTSIRVESRDLSVRKGRKLEVAGFVDTSHTFASLINAEVRDCGSVDLPKPRATTFSQLLDAQARSGLNKARSLDMNGQSVILEGTLLRVDWKRERVPTAVRIGVGDRTFPAFLPIDQELTPKQMSAWVPGAQVKLTGIAEYDFGKERDPSGEYPLIAFHLWLHGPSAMQVVDLPPWWTPSRLATMIVSLVVVLGVVLGWTAILRHQVKAQMRMIRQQIEREAIQEERTRIARDMHDEVGARLSKLAIMQDLYAKDHIHHEKERKDLKQLALDTQDAIHSLDEVVWMLNPQNDTLESMVEYIAHYASNYLEPAAISCRFEMPMDWPQWPVRSHIRQELVYACKEALQNVVKHAHAAEVIVRMRCCDENLIIEIADDGIGLTAQSEQFGCDGIKQMKSRLASIHGECRIQPRQPRGTLVIMELKLLLASLPSNHS